MTSLITTLLSDLEQAGVAVWVESDGLHVRAPRGTLDSTLKTRLTEQRDDLVDFLTAEGADRAPSRVQPPSEFPELCPAPDERFEPFPLTDLQQSYWMGRIGAFGAVGVACHAYAEVDIGGLDASRFERAVRATIDRHEMLRCVIDDDGEQRILEKVPAYRVRTRDCRNLSPERTQAILDRTRDELSHHSPPVDTWPLFQLRATQVSGGHTRIHFSIDLLIADALALHLVLRDVFRIYLAPDEALPALDVSFRDYVLAERRFRETETYQRSRRYWLDRVDELPTAPLLPTQRNLAELETIRFEQWAAELEPERWQQLQDRAARDGLTASNVFLAAFAEVIERHSDTSHFLLNVPLFNRAPVHPDINQLVGDFTSVNLFEVDNRANNTFRERAHRIQEQLLSDLDHASFSGVSVLREHTLRTATTSGAPWVVFTDARADPEVRRQAGQRRNVSSEVVYSISQTPQVCLDHQLVEHAGTLRFNWDVVDDLFPDGVVDAMFDDYTQLLERLVDDEDAWIDGLRRPRTLPIQTYDYPANPSGLLHQGLERAAQEHPDHTAVICGHNRIHYRALDQAANRLARKLQRCGAHPNQLVAVCANKSIEQIIATVAILKAGAAYLPIDPALPEQRKRLLLDTTEARILVTQNELREQLEPITAGAGIQLLTPNDDDLEAFAPDPIEPQQIHTDLAYTLFTSGSTGLPKGVMIDHRGARLTLEHMRQLHRIDHNDVVLGLSALSFDLSVFDLFATFDAAATLVLPTTEDAQPDPEHWSQLLNQHHITIWNSVPALFQILVDYQEEKDDNALQQLRLVLLSGDWIPTTLPERARERAPRLAIYSLGGATEASIWSVHFPIDHVDPHWNSIPYGKALPGQAIEILDEHLNPCPDWVTGNICIAGDGLALGYWKDPERTNQAFLHHPVTGQRLYKTGDLGRRTPDGNLEILGRSDFQVKVQGYRIELGEIEAALELHTHVANAVVQAYGQRDQPRRLAAFVRLDDPQDDADDIDDELRIHLEQRLPHYMVPAVFVPIQELPLSPNGKIDRRLLPDPFGSEQVELDDDAPVTDTVRRIADITAAVMRLHDVDPRANLMQLGVTSVDLLRIANRIESQLDCRPKLLDLLRLQTLPTIGKHLDELREDWEEGEL